jgi:hypothetical protein
MNTDPERKKETQPLTCNCGDKADHFCGKVYPHADANNRQCWWGLAICIVVGVFAAAVLVVIRGCR